VPLSRIYRVLKTIPSYITSVKPIRRFPRRPYEVSGFGSLLQADIAFMFEKMTLNIFWLWLMCLVDTFTVKL